jgi:hypothetical protein
MSERTAHEKYLDGDPISAELADVRDGMIDLDAPEPTRGAPARSPVRAGDDILRPLTSEERADLKAVLLGDGWQVMQLLWEKMFHQHKKSAISQSQVDPLHNREAIAEQWAYFAMLRRARFEFDALVQAETAELDKKVEAER